MHWRHQIDREPKRHYNAVRPHSSLKYRLPAPQAIVWPGILPMTSVGAKPLYIEPGSPWENGYCESFNGIYRAGPYFAQRRERVRAEKDDYANYEEKHTFSRRSNPHSS
jgi:transposase InsO family protein